MDEDIVKRLERIEVKVDGLIERVSALEAKASTTNTLIRWVVFPLIVLLGGLVGIKLVFPT